MEHYVTLFDSLFLPQGLALHISMERHLTKYTLWILCVDDEAFEVLTKLQLPHVRLLRLSELETEELLRVKPTRSKGEYCWTLTPFAPRFVFEKESAANRVTYLDADLWFRSDPTILFEEFDRSGKTVLITQHAYAPECDHSELSGVYCVQFLTFTRNAESIRKWWESKCIEWCFAKHEKGLFGDQKYLELWPIKFKDQIYDLNPPSRIMAPWNVTRYPYSECVCYHFHGLRIGRMVQFSTGYFLPIPVLKNIYVPYIDDLRNSRNLLLSIEYKQKLQKCSILSRVIYLRWLVSLARICFSLVKYSHVKF